MPKREVVRLADLRLDRGNARLVDDHPDERSAILALAAQQGAKLVRMAADLVEYGLDPMSTASVLRTHGGRLEVREGNRRILALKALETPSLVTPALKSAETKRLNALAERFAQAPVDRLEVLCFESGEEATLNRWVQLRHTGLNDGIGLAEWGADEKDRFAARHGKRSPAGQILDFVAAVGDDEAKQHAARRSGRGGIISSVKRLIGTPAVRERLGITIKGGVVLSEYPSDEVAPGLMKLVADLATETIKVKDIYEVKDRVRYARGLPSALLPTKTRKLSDPIPLPDLPSKEPSGRPTTAKASKWQRPSRPRNYLIPKSCALAIAAPRTRKVVEELRKLDLEAFPNATSVLFRVFIELSVDHYLNQHAATGAAPDDVLAKKVRVVAAHLEGAGVIAKGVLRTITGVASSRGGTIGLVTFHQYVHSQNAFPKADHLRDSWDEMQPFIEGIWK